MSVKVFSTRGFAVVCGTWQVVSNGNCAFRFTVVNKNAASSGFALAFDHFKLTPASSELPSAPTLTATLQGGMLILSWSTNAAGFNLQYTDDLAANWNAALPSPVVLNGFNFVTNSLNGSKRFYRLKWP